MSFLGASSPFTNNSYNSFSNSQNYSQNQFMGNNYNPMMNQQQPNQQQNLNQQNQQDYQFDLRRDVQATIGGLNASLGLAYGVTQMLNLSTIGVKYLFKAIKFVLSKIFNTNNIIAPLKFMVNLVFGTKSQPRQRQVNQSLSYLEDLWKQSEQYQPNQPRKIFGINPTLFKSIMLAAVGLVVQFTLFLLQKNKLQKLEELKRKEEEEKQKLMEEEWRKQQENDSVELVLLREFDDNIVDVKVYDGELNSMTFNQYKNSEAFKKKQRINEILLEEADQDESTEISITQERSNMKFSEDGWDNISKLSSKQVSSLQK